MLAAREHTYLHTVSSRSASCSSCGSFSFPGPLCKSSRVSGTAAITPDAYAHDWRDATLCHVPITGTTAATAAIAVLLLLCKLTCVTVRKVKQIIASSKSSRCITLSLPNLEWPTVRGSLPSGGNRGCTDEQRTTDEGDPRCGDPCSCVKVCPAAILWVCRNRSGYNHYRYTVVWCTQSSSHAQCMKLCRGSSPPAAEAAGRCRKGPPCPRSAIACNASSSSFLGLRSPKQCSEEC